VRPKKWLMPELVKNRINNKKAITPIPTKEKETVVVVVAAVALLY